jgi:DNA-binding beta-propeller fold protein YncE
MFTVRMSSLGWAVLAVAGYAAFTVSPAQADLLVVSSGISGGLNTILRYSDSGTFLGVFVPPGGGGLNGPDLGIIRGPDGNVYVNSFVNDAVMRYEVNTGANLSSPGNPGAQFVPSRSGGLNGPDGLGFGGPGGNLYVAAAGDNTVKRYDPTTGAFAGTIVAPGFGGLANPKDLRFGPDGNLYVSNGDSSGKVLRYNPVTGDPIPGPGRAMANFIDPRPGLMANGVAFGPDGNLVCGLR